MRMKERKGGSRTPSRHGFAWCSESLSSVSCGLGDLADPGLAAASPSGGTSFRSSRVVRARKAVQFLPSHCTSVRVKALLTA